MRTCKPIETDTTFDMAGLLCPECGGEGCLHHKAVQVFQRDEDATSYYTIVGEIPKKLNEVNPSERRDGMRVYFECERCGDVSPFALVQHKGNTLLYWELKEK